MSEKEVRPALVGTGIRTPESSPYGASDLPPWDTLEPNSVMPGGVLEIPCLLEER